MNTHPHIFQFISACIEKAISMGYEYDQEKSLQVIHEEAKEYIKGCGEVDKIVTGQYNWETEILSFEINGNKTQLHVTPISHFPDGYDEVPKTLHITDDGILYRIEA